jgi:hypothetical protein
MTVRRIGRLILTAGAALLGLLVGFCGGAVSYVGPPSDSPEFAEYAPLPHHVPSHQGGASFRFAMAHDVIHERYPKRGPAYYRERDRVTRAQLAKLSPDAPRAFSLTDDLAAGLHRLGRTDEAIPLMRAKLARQKANGLDGSVLYTSYANLGTFLVHESFTDAVAGDEAARERFREGIGFIRKAVEVNAQAHFGREQWQAAFAEFLLAAMEKPQLLTTFDFLGNRLDLSFEDVLMRPPTEKRSEYGRPYDRAFVSHGGGRGIRAFDLDGSLDDPTKWQRVSHLREHVTKVGAEEGWEDVAVPSHRKPVAFDEPCLGIIGMWRQGGGANPHFALALGETMLRVGQRYVAWGAYERAARLADQFWPDKEAQRALREHCRRRQAEIEKTLSGQGSAPSRRLGPPPPEGTVEGLRPAFEAELAHGEDYQRAYQKYEQEKIAAGVPISDEKFFDDFHAGREPIASPTGSEEWLAYVAEEKAVAGALRGRFSRGLTWGGLVAGLAALLAALVIRLRPRREPDLRPPPGLPDEEGDARRAEHDQRPDHRVGGQRGAVGEPAVEQQGEHDADEGDPHRPA